MKKRGSFACARLTNLLRTLVLAVILVLWGGLPASAATFTVTNLSDGTTNGICNAAGQDDGCTLREAVTAANSTTASDVITFSSGLTGSIKLLKALPHLSTELTINGPTNAFLSVERSGDVASADYFSTFYVDNAATVTIASLTLRNGGGTTSQSNAAPSNIYNFDGGAVCNADNSEVILRKCTLSGNTAISGGGAFNAGTMRLINCTITSNKVVSLLDRTAQGAAIYNKGALFLNSCTVFDNGGATSGGGIYNNSSVTVAHTIIAGNTTSNVNGSGAYTSQGYNLIGSNTQGSGEPNQLNSFNQSGDQINVTNTQMKLGTLQNNGGPTFTRALGAGSIAINAGDPSIKGGNDTDQRGTGYPRVVDGRIDIGAYEYQTASTAVTVKGKVYNAVALSGLSGITVKAVYAGTTTVVAQTTTDSSGNYSLSLVPGSYTLSAAKGDSTTFRLNPLFTNPVNVMAGSTGDTAYNFRAVGIGGRVISPSNVGISGVKINLYAQSDTTAGTALLTSTTDAQGFFSLDGVAAGTWNVVPVSPTTYTYSPTSKLVTVGDSPVFISFSAATKAGYRIMGRITSVQSGESHGLAGITVKARHSVNGATITNTTTTNSEGNYTFSDLEEGSYSVEPVNANLLLTYAPTPNQPQPLALTGQAPTRSGINFIAKPFISGRVYNAVALEGIAGVVVKAVRQSDGVVFAVGTNSAGTYVLPLEVGTYEVSAFLPHNNDYRFTPLFTNPITIDDVPQSATICNFRVVGISGRIITSENKGVGGVKVSLYAPSDTAFKTPLRTSVTNAQGFFSLDGVAANTWVVKPVSPDSYTYMPGSRTVVVGDATVFVSFMV